MIFYKYSSLIIKFLVMFLIYFQIFLYRIIMEYALKHFLLFYQEQF